MGEELVGENWFKGGVSWERNWLGGGVSWEEDLVGRRS